MIISNKRKIDILLHLKEFLENKDKILKNPNFFNSILKLSSLNIKICKI